MELPEKMRDVDTQRYREILEKAKIWLKFGDSRGCCDVVGTIAVLLVRLIS